MHIAEATVGQRVVYATGDVAETLVREVAALGGTRVMLIAATSQVPLRVAAELPIVVWQSEVTQHVPTELAAHAADVAVANDVDLVLSLGGGSAVGLAKAIALRTGLPIIAVPTTFSGAEATSVWGLTEAGTKATGVDDRVIPRVIVYDASLTRTLPTELAAWSGVNALAHCVDALWAPSADEGSELLALEGVRVLREFLPQVVADPEDLDARERTLSGAYLGAAAFTRAGSGLQHAICDVVGSAFDLPHARTHAVVLPHVLAFNAPAAPRAQELLADALGAETAIDGIRLLCASLGVRGGLRDCGMPESGIAAAVEAVLDTAPASNPTLVTKENLTALIRAAWEGETHDHHHS